MNEALSGLIGAVLGAAFALLGVILTNKLGYKKLFAEVVSKNRMDWINNFREEFSVFLGTVRFLQKCDKSENRCKQNEKKEVNDSSCCACDIDICAMICKAEKARVKLLTRLNQDIYKDGNEYNKDFSERLEKIDLYSANSCDDEQIEKLIDLSRKILEPEWVRVKKEAKGENQHVVL